MKRTATSANTKSPSEKVHAPGRDIFLYTDDTEADTTESSGSSSSDSERSTGSRAACRTALREEARRIRRRETRPLKGAVEGRQGEIIQVLESQLDGMVLLD